MQKIKRKHAPSTRELDPSPRSRSRPRTRASVALPPRPFLYIYSVCVYLSFSLFFLFFLGEKFKSREEKKVELWTNGLKTKKFWLRLGQSSSRGAVGPKKKKLKKPISLRD
jgi:hypothetical protein